jgi:PTH1 family peptidyl-tRNA hydrolase
VKLLFGLGNPGSAHRFNRHNFGYLACEKAASNWKQDFDTLECQALTARITLFPEEIMLAKPLTFMNHSGRSAKRLVEKYNIDLEDFIAIYDDIDLKLGVIRIKRKGGAGFHRGVISLIENLRSEDFPRLRLGVLGGKGYSDLSEFVLSDFDKEESITVQEMTDTAVDALETIILQGVNEAMRIYNRKQIEENPNL